MSTAAVTELNPARPPVPKPEKIKSKVKADDGKKSSKSKKRKLDDDSTSAANEAKATASSTEEAVGVPEPKPKKSKKSKTERKPSAAEEEPTSAEQQPPIASSSSSPPASIKPKKEKKVKKLKAEKEVERTLAVEALKDEEASVAAGDVEGLRPMEDLALSDNGQRAVAYALDFNSGGSNKKFQKARQNFLIRNVYNPVEIPDKYLPPVLEYLLTCKGGSRTAITDGGHLILAPPPPPPSPPPPPATTEPTDEDVAPVENLEKEPALEQEVQSEEDVVRRKERARAVLRAFGEPVTEDGVENI